MSDRDDEYMMPKALIVPDLSGGYDPSVPPASAEEYLQSVMWEAKQCKDVVTVEMDKEKLKKLKPLVKVQAKMTAPSGYGPSRKELTLFQTKFIALRKKINETIENSKCVEPAMQLPNEFDEQAWCVLCFGEEFNKRRISAENNIASLPELSDGSMPLLSILLNISAVCVSNLIDWHTKWLEKLGFSTAQGRWLFALLAVLHKPLIPEQCSTLRHIVKLLAVIRASLVSKDHVHLPDINMLITIITTYFGQSDLGDDIP